jgi:hypothetical protein
MAEPAGRLTPELARYWVLDRDETGELMEHLDVIEEQQP